MRLVLENTSEGVSLKPEPVFSDTRPKGVFGSLAHDGPPRSLQKMQAGVLAQARSPARRHLYAQHRRPESRRFTSRKTLDSLSTLSRYVSSPAISSLVPSRRTRTGRACTGYRPPDARGSARPPPRDPPRMELISCTKGFSRALSVQ